MPSCLTCKYYPTKNTYLKDKCFSCTPLYTNYEFATEPTETALSVQEGGDHYKSKAIQPVVYIHANKLGFCEGNVVKYITRYKEKNGIEDLKKAKHYIELLIEMESK